MAMRVRGKSRNFQVSATGSRKVTIGDKEYDLSNITKLATAASGDQDQSTLTITNYVNRQGAAQDQRTVFEKAHATGSNRFTVTLPFSESDQDMLSSVQVVSDKLEEVFRSYLQKFSKDYRIEADRENLVRSEAYRRAKRDLTYDREMTEAERDRLIGDLMPKKRNAGRFDLQIRMSVKDPKFDKVSSTAWRDTEVGRVGTYNAFGVGSLPLTNKIQVDAAVKISELVAGVIIPVVAGKTDLKVIWTELAKAVDVLKVQPGYDPNATAGYSKDEEAKIERIKLEMIARLS